jgi:hypothetical protein
LVFGLGTRAVDRTDDDYTRVVALNAPDMRPEANFDEMAQYAQHRVDYLDLEANQEVSDYFMDVVKDAEDLQIDMFASLDPSQPRNTTTHRILTFDKLLKETGFVADMREILETLKTAYNYPVDIEFTANYMNDGNYRINLLQCRPLQVYGSESVELPEIDVADEQRIIEANGAVVGQSRVGQIDRFIYVVPRLYGQLPVNTRHGIARLIGDINRLDKQKPPKNTMIIGPGRWGTSSPSLGIPVSFNDIKNVSILCEIVAMHDNLVPDVSLGTHFLNELVEMKMLYLALFPDQGGNYLNNNFFEESPNKLTEMIPSAEKWKDVLRVIDADDVAQNGGIRIIADALHQRVSCHFVKS